MTAFPQRLRELREAQGLSRQQIANLFGYQRTAPLFWEQGKREPRFDDLMRLADYLGVTTDYLLGVPDAERDSATVERAKSLLASYLQVRGNLLGTTPAERIAMCYRLLSETAPVQFTRERVASQLLLTPAAFDRLLANESLATPIVVAAFSRVSGVDEQWFWIPDPSLRKAQ